MRTLEHSPQYAAELSNLGTTYQSAIGADVALLMKAIAAVSQSSLIGVGSGGSFTVASLLCNLHEKFTGLVSRPSTPLEIIANPTLASNSPAFFISAEGKNPDIVEALKRARYYSARTIYVLTNREVSPLGTTLSELSDIDSHVFELPQKDGYLATNSLLMDAVLVARAYGGLNGDSGELPPSIDDLQLESGSIAEWVENAAPFAEAAVHRRGLIVLYSPSLKPIAADLESKLSESALLYVQIADLRSFAHGRHLWLAERANDCAVLALVDVTLTPLWMHMRNLMPADVPFLEINVKSEGPRDLITALLAELHFVGTVGECSARDPGRPQVPDFGRQIYYAQLSDLVLQPVSAEAGGVHEKFEVIGAHWPYRRQIGVMQRARDTYSTTLQQQTFRAVVFDYDGTLCSAQRRGSPPTERTTEHLLRLLGGGILLAIVSGRGGSMRDELRTVIPEAEWQKIRLALYSGGLITNLAADDQVPPKRSEFLNHVSRIARGLKNAGVPIERITPTPPFQVSIRFEEGVDTELIWFVVADALRQAGLDLRAVVRSRHSIDVLEPAVSKTRFIATLLQEHRILPHDLLAVGDQGAWPGNDASLLEHRFSLSVDFPSRRLDRGWKLAPHHKRGVDAADWYLERMLSFGEGYFKVVLDTHETAKSS